MSTTRISGRRSAILPTLIIAAVLVVAFAIFTSFWTERLWYQSMDFGTVFSTMLLTRIGLFVGFGLLMAVMVGGNAVLAYRLRSKTRLGPPTSPLLERYRELLDARLVWVVLAVGGAGRALRRRRRGRSGGHLPRLAARHALRCHGPEVRAGHRLLRLRLPLVAVRHLVPVHGPGLRHDRRGRRALHHRRPPLQRSGAGWQRRRPGAPVGAGRSGRAGQGRQLLVRPVRVGDRQHHARR